MISRRKRIEELLERDGYTPSQLAKILEVDLAVVIEDLKHIARS